tara:strand:+ start:43 stop:5130 length:5088 start_codon:yes stop_codon:yes gene_type:complete
MSQKSKPTTFTKGMISDNDPRYQEPGSYRDAENIQIINKDGTTFTVENIDGNTQKLDLLDSGITVEDTDDFINNFTGPTPAWPFTLPQSGLSKGYLTNIVGHYSYNNQLFLIIVGLTDQSIDQLDYRTIFLVIDFNYKGNVTKITDLKVAWESNTVNNTIVTNQHPNLNMHLNTSVKIEGIIENECISRIYFTDNVNPLRTINLRAKNLYSLNPDEINVTPQAFMNQPVLDSSLSGRLPVGVYQYAFKYVNDNGAETGMSPLSNLMHISNRPSSSYKNYFGGPKGQLSGDGFGIKIYDLDTNYDNVELYALLWESLDIPPVVAKVAIKSITTNTVSFKHTSFDNIIENGIEDVLIRTNTWDVCKDIAIKDNILFAANLRQTQNYISEKEWNVPVYRFNHDATKARLTCDFGEDIVSWNQSLGVIESIGIQTIGGVSYSTGAVNIDVYNDKSDGKGTYDNTGQYLYSDGAHRYIGQEPVESATGANRHVLGGESYDFANNELGGCRVTFRLKRKLADSKYNNGGVMTTTTYIDANETAEILETDNIAGDNDPTATSNVTNGNTVYKNTMSFSGSKDPQIAGSFRGYQRGEKYRFGVLTYDLNGNPGNVLWIGDLQMPTHYDIHYELDLSRHQLGSSAGNIEIKANEYTQDYRLSIHGGEKVPAAKRHYDNRQYDSSTNDVLNGANGQRLGFLPPGSSNELHLFDLHLDFEFRIPENVRKKISGFRVVRAERNEEDRTIIQQGLYNFSTRYGIKPTDPTTDRKNGYKDVTNLDEDLELDHIGERINTPDEPVCPPYDDLLNGYYGLDVTSGKGESFDDSNMETLYFPEGDARDTAHTGGFDFTNGPGSSVFSKSHYAGSYEFSWKSGTNPTAFAPAYQFFNNVGTLDSPDSAFGTRPYVHRDGDRLRIDGILKALNEDNLTGANNAPNYTGTNNYDDSVKFSGVKETDGDKNSGIIVNKYSVYDTYFPCYVKALHYQVLTVRAYADKAYKIDAINDSGHLYFPLSVSENEESMKQVDQIRNAKEITAGEIVSTSFFDSAQIDGYNGWSNHSLGYYRANSVPGNPKFSILSQHITKDEVEFDNVSTLQTGTRSILIETNFRTRIRNIKKILAIGNYDNPNCRSTSYDTHNSKIPYKYLCSIVRPNETQYGGGTKDSIYNTTYIVAGNFHRINSNNDTENHLSTVAGGDTFVNFYSHQKTISPFSDKSYSTWNVFPVESYVNTDMRSGLHLAAGDTEEGYDITTPPFSNDWLYNEVYSQENTLQRYLAVEDEGCKFTELPFEVAYSETKLSGETSDAFRTFPIFNFHDVEAAYGQINNLFNFQNEVYFIQDKGFGRLLVNPRTFISDEQQGVPLFTGTGETIESHTYISTQYGSRHQSGMINTEDSIYFVDVSTKKIIQFKNQELKILSDSLGIKNKLEKYLTEINYFNNTKIDVIPSMPRLHRTDFPLSFEGITTGYDPVSRDVIFTFKQERNHPGSGITYPNRHFSLVYNENLEAFTTKWSVYPQHWITHMDKLYTTRRRIGAIQPGGLNPQGYGFGNLELWEWGTHPLDYKNHFYYDTDSGSTIAKETAIAPIIGDDDMLISESNLIHVINDASLENKVYDNMQIITNGGTLYSSEFQTDVITEIQTSYFDNPSIASQAKYREGILRFPLRAKEMSATGQIGPRMRGTYLENKIVANTKEKFNIFAILAKYRKSFN